MRTLLLRLVCAAVLALGLPACDDDDELPARDEAPPLDELASALEAELEARGYEVARGAWRLFSQEDCAYAIESIGNCMANNPTAPYIIPSVPLWDDEHVDEAMRDALGPGPGDTWTTFRIDAREAIVVLGELPPQAGYFGLQTYVFTRDEPIDPSDPIYQQLPADLRALLFAAAPNPERTLVFSSIGNSNNAALIERETGAAFGEQRYFIATPDAVMNDAIADALLQAGVPDAGHIFTEPVSPEVVRVGLDAAADDLLVLLRFAEPDDADAGAAWRDALPLVVLRVRDPDTARATQPYPVPAYDPKGGRSELALAGDVEDLVAALRQQWGEPDAPALPFVSMLLAVDLVGQHCLERPMNCLGDTQDTDYQQSPSVTVDAGEVLAVVGALATATDNATYVSLSLNRLDVLEGVGNLTDEDLQGTAASYGGTVANTAQLYRYYLARDCAGLDPCFEITEAMVPPGTALRLVERNYIVPGTVRGPDPTLLVNPTLVVLGTTEPTSLCPAASNAAGGYSDASLDDAGVQAAAAFAVGELTGSSETLYRLQCAQTQVVTGTNYRLGLTIEGVDYLVVVSRALDGSFSLASSMVVE